MKPLRLLLIAVCSLAVGGQAFGQPPPGQQKTAPHVTPAQHAPAPSAQADDAKMEPVVRGRAHAPKGQTRVIITMRPGLSIDRVVTGSGGRMGRHLKAMNARVAEVSDTALKGLAHNPNVARIDLDRPVVSHMARTNAVIGARYVQEQLGLDGAGIGVAVIDSGVTSWHDDLMPSPAADAIAEPAAQGGSQRVVQFVDLVANQPTAYDDYGHGTHVAGIIAGNGYDSGGARAGVAPAASLVVLKVLDGNGGGYMSDVIAAFDYAVANKDAFNIRVINLSIGAPITQSYATDPLTLAAKRAVDAGIVVVTSAGNFGRNLQGQTQYGGITAPGNAPWVITVGASTHMGTLDRGDDAIAGYSSRGPSYIDYSAKPDLVAPGTGIESLSDPSSTLYRTRANALVPGTVETSYLPYLSLSGTSMAAPVVTGAVALLLQANPALTPNAVKAILEDTAEARPGINALSQGAGFLNVRGAVRLAQFFADPSAGLSTTDALDFFAGSSEAVYWSRHLIWGNHRIGGGMILPAVNAWDNAVAWGSADTEAGDNIVWGSSDADNIVWGSSVEGDNIVWGSSSDSDNIVWGSSCAGADCDNIVWGSSTVDANGDNIVWGSSSEGDNIVWGSSSDGDNIVWGSSAVDDIVWGDSVLFTDGE